MTSSIESGTFESDRAKLTRSQKAAIIKRLADSGLSQAVNHSLEPASLARLAGSQLRDCELVLARSLVA